MPSNKFLTNSYSSLTLSVLRSSNPGELFSASTAELWTSFPSGWILQNRCYMWRMMSSPVAVRASIRLFRILKRLKECEIKDKNDYFRSFRFGCTNKSRSSPKHLTDLTPRSRRRFALSLTTGFLVTTLAWTDGTTFMPISSHFSLGMIGFLVTSSTKLKRRT